MFLSTERMSTKKILSRPRGTQDIFSIHSLLFYQLQKKIIQVLEKNNYHPIIFPTLEYEQLFRNVLENSGVSKEMYVFSDRKGRMLALRPEGTLSTARVWYQNNLGEKSSVHKFYYWANMFRYERPQKGRYREFWQLGVELLGAKGLQADLQILQLVKDILFEVGVRNFTFHLNYIGSKEIQENYQEQLRVFLKEKYLFLCSDCQKRYYRNSLRILDCFNCKKKWDFPSYKLVWTSEITDYIELLNVFLDFLKIPFSYDYKLVRGLDYYTGLVFEVYLNEEEKAFLGGGRYDNLYERLGGKCLPSVGFALGVDRLTTFLLSQKNLNFETRLDIFFLNYFETAYKEILLWKEILVSYGFKVDYNLEVTFGKKEILEIERSNQPRIWIIIKEKFFLEGYVFLKNDVFPKWKKIKKEEIIEIIKNYFSELSD